MEITIEQKAKKIKEICLNQTGRNPLQIAEAIMKDPFIKIHGPEHHIIDGAAFLTALHNAGMEFDLAEALDEQITRGRRMPGATCGNWGVCGSVSSVGAALSIVRGTGPLSDSEYYKDNMRFTSIALGKIAEIGGPRCCKRNAFISLKTAVEFVNERYSLNLEQSEIKCRFSPKNLQCIGSRCPFHHSRKDV